MESKSAALVGAGAGSGDSAAVVLDDHMGDGEAQAGAGGAGAALGGEEGFENAIEHVGSHAAAIVGDRKLDGVVVALEIDGNLARRTIEGLKSIEGEVEQDLFHLAFAGEDVEEVVIGG